MTFTGVVKTKHERIRHGALSYVMIAMGLVATTDLVLLGILLLQKIGGN